MTLCDHKTFYGISKDYFEKTGCIHTATEIGQQPMIWKELGDLLMAKQEEISAFHDKIGDLKDVRIIFTGAGSSAFIGDALAPLIAKSAGIKAESIPTTDIVTSPGSHLFADIPTLLVSFARSGNSPESMGAVVYARTVIKNLFELCIVCDDTSKLAQLTQESAKSLTLVMPQGTCDKAFAMTSSVSSMLLAGFAFFNKSKINDLIKDMTLLSAATTAGSIQMTKAALKWSEKDFDRIIYLGCGFLKHIAHEASLKMLELTSGTVNGSYESATGFRHGPKSVIKDKTTTVHLISPDSFTAKYDLDLLKEVYHGKKQNMVIAVGSAKTDGTTDGGTVGDGAVGDEIITLPANDYGVGSDICPGLQMLVFCQMLAMFKSLALGIATDDPSPSGEVNRVVKGVTIYEYP